MYGFMADKFKATEETTSTTTVIKETEAPKVMKNDQININELEAVVRLLNTFNPEHTVTAIGDETERGIMVTRNSDNGFVFGVTMLYSDDIVSHWVDGSVVVGELLKGVVIPTGSILDGIIGKFNKMVEGVEVSMIIEASMLHKGMAIRGPNIKGTVVLYSPL